MAEVGAAAGLDVEQVRTRVLKLEETNPMLGHRGCRLGITYPEIYEMQARAIFEAAVVVQQDKGETVHPEVMVPLVAWKRELEILREMIERVAGEIASEAGITIEYTIGTMIELPRAALQAKQIAEAAEFFSFGTNDLTQTTFGLSRDDAGNFLPAYEAHGIVEHDPFVTLDTSGVGELLDIAAERGRMSRSDIKLGICGEHGGDPATIHFCEDIGLDYVSCSPFRVPIARLAAAQASAKDPSATSEEDPAMATA